MIGITSGILTLLEFGFESGIRLHNYLKDLKDTPNAIRALRDEAKSIADVLPSLRSTISGTDHEFDPLKGPIFHCGEACRKLQASLTQLSGAGSKAQSWKDYLKMRYMGKDIRESKDMLSGYKATISIAIGDANL